MSDQVENSGEVNNMIGAAEAPERVSVVDLVVGMTAAFLGTIVVLSVIGRIVAPDVMAAVAYLAH